MDDEQIKKAVAETRLVLSDIAEPEKSLSFPVILAFLLNTTGATSGSTPKEIRPKSRPGADEKFKGLTGGVRLLFREGFFKEGRSQGDVYAELQRQGYHYPKSSLPFTLISFVQKRILTRMKGPDGNWRYIERK